MKNNSSTPFRRDPLLGSLDIGVLDLLKQCEDNQRKNHLFNSMPDAHKLFADVTLEFVSSRSQTETDRKGTLTVLLHEIDQAEVGSTAVTAARHNIETRGIAISKKLQDLDNYPNYLDAFRSIVAQLDTLVQGVDQAAKVSRRRMLGTRSTTLMNGTSCTHMP